MKESEYIPGFDWMRIFGSILVVVSHFNVFDQAIADHLLASRMLSVVVPVFFIMSGFLCSRGFSKERVFRQVIKYGAIFLAIQFFLVFWVHASAYARSGQGTISGLGIDLLKALFFRHYYARQLWFIPALLYPMLLNAFLDSSWKRRIVIGIAAAFYLFIQTVGAVSILQFLETYMASNPSVAKFFTPAELNRILLHFATGLLFTTIGFDIGTWKTTPIHLLVAAVPVVLFEVYVRFIGVTPILLSILFYEGIKRIPGTWMYPYHFEISVFSGAMYFLHFFGIILIKKYISMNPLIGIPLIIATNILITVAASCFVRRRRARANIDMNHGL